LTRQAFLRYSQPEFFIHAVFVTAVSIPPAGGSNCTNLLLFVQLNRPVIEMKIKNSLKALKARHRDNRMVRRKGRIYIINKTAPRFKARQG